jgi:hypothetical protein
MSQIDRKFARHLVLMVVGVLCLLLPSVGAVSCNCYYGHVISSQSCECSCNSGYLGPTCSFTVSDTVSIQFSLNMTASEFVAELFTNAVTYAASATATFVYATNVTAFNKVRATVTLPGYAVSRLISSVTYRDPWVSQYGVVSASVVTPSTATDSSEFNYDHTFYQSGNITITLMGVVFLAAAIVLTIGLLVVANLGINNEEDAAMVPTAVFSKKKVAKKNNSNLGSGGNPGGSASKYTR